MPLIELDTKAFRDDVKAEARTHLFSLLKLMVQMLSLWMMYFTQVMLIRAAIDNIVSHGRPARVVWLFWLTVVYVVISCGLCW